MPSKHGCPTNPSNCGYTANPFKIVCILNLLKPDYIAKHSTKHHCTATPSKRDYIANHSKLYCTANPLKYICITNASNIANTADLSSYIVNYLNADCTTNSSDHS